MIDYKFFCFNGEPTFCQVISDRSSDKKIDFYDMEWNRLIGLSDNIHSNSFCILKPLNFEKMKRFVGILSKNIPFSRIDFYETNGHLYFGEITFYPVGGFGEFRLKEWNEKNGRMIMLPH